MNNMEGEKSYHLLLMCLKDRKKKEKKKSESKL